MSAPAERSERTYHRLSPIDGVPGRSSLIRLQAADASVTLDPGRGGRLASLEVGGRELLVGPSSDEDRSTQWGCFLMAPWPGRLAGGRLHWAGRDHQLTRTSGDHALHGVVHDRPWEVASSTDDRAELVHPLGRPAWPFAGLVRQAIRLEPGGLTLEAEILAREDMPAALGWHPWFLRRGADPRVRLAADHVLELRDELPTGALLAVDDRTDFRGGPALGDRRLDDVYVGARSPAEIAWPDLHLSMAFGDPIAVIVVYTPPEGFCVEPQTAWPNALGLPADRALVAGARALQAGESLAARLELRWE